MDSMNPKSITAAIHQQIAALAEPDYQAFASKLLPGETRLLGVRLPRLRQLARQWVRAEGPAAVDACLADCAGADASFEYLLLTGMMIGCAATPRAPWPQSQAWITAYIPHLRNWSLCDSFCAGLKVARSRPQELWALLLPYLDSEKEYDVRFAVVMMLNYYLDDAHIDEVLNALHKNRHPAYMAQMAVGWALSAAYVRYPERTMVVLRRPDMVTAVRRIALRKIIESLRVTAEQREDIRRFRRECGDKSDS